MSRKESARMLKAAVVGARKPKSLVKEVRNPAMRCAKNTVIVL